MTLTAVLSQSSPTMKSGATPSVLAFNKLIGLIVARRHPHRRHYQVRTADGIHVTVHDPTLSGHGRALPIGQQLTMRIPPHAVLISPARPIEEAEDNVWAARVVLPAGQRQGSLLMVKIIGRPWTLTCTQQEGRLTRPLRAWDRVTVRIRPEACIIDHRYPGDSRLRPRLLTSRLACPPIRTTLSRIDAHLIRLIGAGDRSPVFPAPLPQRTVATGHQGRPNTAISAEKEVGHISYTSPPPAPFPSASSVSCPFFCAVSSMPGMVNTVTTFTLSDLRP